MERLPVFVHAEDPISQPGVVSQLGICHEVQVLLDPAENERAVVSVVVTDEVAEQAMRLLRRLRRTTDSRLVLVVSHMGDAGPTVAVECGVVGLLLRSEATSGTLAKVTMAAARGERSMSADPRGRLPERAGRLRRQVLDPRDISFASLDAREIDVLKLVADGHGTRDIAQHLSYSERTVKNVLHDVTARLQLRNRSHAVAYALRHGLI